MQDVLGCSITLNDENPSAGEPTQKEHTVELAVVFILCRKKVAISYKSAKSFFLEP